MLDVLIIIIIIQIIIINEKKIAHVLDVYVYYMHNIIFFSTLTETLKCSDKMYLYIIEYKVYIYGLIDNNNQ